MPCFCRTFLDPRINKQRAMKIHIYCFFSKINNKIIFTKISNKSAIYGDKLLAQPTNNTHIICLILKQTKAVKKQRRQYKHTFFEH